MSGLPYYKRYPGDALQGMASMTLEERGAYNTILDLLYDQGEPLVDQERSMCAHLNCDPRVWRRVRANLLAVGKIELNEQGRITNARFELERTSAASLREVRRRSGAAGGRATADRREKPKPNSNRRQANAAAGAAASQRPESESIRPTALAHGQAQESPGLDVLAARIYDACSPEVQAKCEQDPSRIERALRKADAAGLSVEVVVAELVEYYRHHNQRKEGGRYARAPHSAVYGLAAGTWEPASRAQATTSRPAPPAQHAAPAEVDAHLDRVWRGRMDDWKRLGGAWKRAQHGPPPGEAGCQAPPALLAEYGVTSPQEAT